MKTETKLKISVSFIISLLLVGFFASNYAIKEIKELKEQNEVIKSIVWANLESGNVYISESKANSYYDEASFAYEKRDYSSVESNCRIARQYFSEASNGYLRIASKLKNRNINHSLINKYIKLMELNSEIQLNMYEACEHFESAARYYAIYFQEDTPVTDKSYSLGNSEIESMNEKIREHDSNVRSYNKLLNEINTELRESIDE